VARRVSLRTILAASCLFAAGAASLAAAATPDKRLDQVQERIEKANDQLAQQDRRAGVLSDEVAGLNDEIREVESRLATLRGQAVIAEGKFATAADELAQRQGELRAERARLARLQAKLTRSRAVLADRLVSLYKADSPDILTVVLNTDGFADLINQAEFVRRIGRQDRIVLATVSRAKDDAERQERRLAALEARQRGITATLERERDRVTGLQQDVEDTRAELALARDARQDRLDATRVTQEHLADDVAGLEQVQRRLEQRLSAAQSANADEFAPAPAGPVVPSSGGWIMPVSGVLTSPFCEVRSYESCHPGIDIGAPMGTPIRATRAGQVILIQSEAASGGYGNLTCIQHDASISSCYAHQSSFATSSGASVAAGQVIGYVGSTGNSTGPHLHFEIRVNGSVVDPFDYV
jgi:peptidoglycan DL-endopeptidase CwlO